jgi:hypothetical protein
MSGWGSDMLQWFRIFHWLWHVPHVNLLVTMSCPNLPYTSCNNSATSKLQSKYWPSNFLIEFRKTSDSWKIKVRCEWKFCPPGTIVRLLLLGLNRDVPLWRIMLQTLTIAVDNAQDGCCTGDFYYSCHTPPPPNIGEGGVPMLVPEFQCKNYPF